MLPSSPLTHSCTRAGEHKRPRGPEACGREHQPRRFHPCGKPEKTHSDSEIHQLPFLQRGTVKSRRGRPRTRLDNHCFTPCASQNFQFEFQEYPEILFDKVIEIKVGSGGSAAVSSGEDPLTPL